MEIDLADRLDDLICTFDKAVNDGPSDILVAIIGWLVFAGGIFLAVGYIINNLRTTLSPANSVSTLGTELSGSKKDIHDKNDSGSSQYTGISSNFNCDIDSSTGRTNDITQTFSTVNKEEKEVPSSPSETSKPKKNFDALDPPVFTITKNGTVSHGPNETSSPPELSNGDSSTKKGFLVSAKDCNENEVSKLDLPEIFSG